MVRYTYQLVRRYNNKYHWAKRMVDGNNLIKKELLRDKPKMEVLSEWYFLWLTSK